MCLYNVNMFQVYHGCETSAVLHHGSFLRFGCLQFAFCVIDYQENDDSTSIEGIKADQESTTPAKVDKKT